AARADRPRRGTPDRLREAVRRVARRRIRRGVGADRRRGGVEGPGRYLAARRPQARNGGAPRDHVGVAPPSAGRREKRGVSVEEVVTTGHEVPVFLQAGDETIFGVLTEPAGPPRGTAVIVVPATAPSSAGFGRENVYLCRRLAGHGYHTFRFDYHGGGDSTGVVERMSLGDLFKADVDAVVGWFGERGIDDVVLVGSCFGSRP